MAIIRGGFRLAGPPLALGAFAGALAAIEILALTPALSGYAGIPAPAHLLALSMALVALGSFLLFTFRDPRRTIGKGIVSPADGIVRSIRFWEGGVHISIFLGVHNVHVVRAPIYGSVKDVTRHRGGHWPAFSGRSTGNERVAVVMNTPSGPVTLTMIAGAFARRIIPYVNVGDVLKKGQKVGFIRFGSRVDLVLPASFQPNVVQGTRVRGALSTIAVESRMPGSKSNYGDAWVMSRQG
ncbi:MAG: phosphatidylserine decarboxylase [Thermoplasmata archaeon]|nr:phosphatidylserine decarboxylase [Thermoplasmata archaeon]